MSRSACSHTSQGARADFMGKVLSSQPAVLTHHSSVCGGFPMRLQEGGCRGGKS